MHGLTSHAIPDNFRFVDLLKQLQLFQEHPLRLKQLNPVDIQPEVPEEDFGHHLG